MHLISIHPRQKGMSTDKFKALIRNKARMKRRPTRGECRFKSALSRAGLECVSQRIFISPEEGKGYIADFYSGKLKLVFEVDGDSHSGRFAEAYDAVRSSLLAKRGIKVVRVTNEQTKDIARTAEWVIEQADIRERELVERCASYKQSKRDKRTTIKTSKAELDSMMEDFTRSGGRVTQCPTVDPKGRKIKRIKWG